MFSLPALRCVRDSCPDAYIASVARLSAAELLKCTGLVDEVFVRKSGFNLAKIKLIKDLASHRFDLALVFSQSAESTLLSVLCGAPRRIGFINTSLGALLTRQVYFSHPPSTENNLRLISEAGLNITCKSYAKLLIPSVKMMKQANALLKRNGIGPDDKLIAICPGTSGRRSVKEWTNEGFADIAAYFSDIGYRIVVIGSSPEDEIVSRCPSIIDLGGKTDLGEVLWTLYRAVAVVAVDSGLLHLAAAAGTMVVGLYGPSNPNATGPQGDGHVVIRSGEECSPCMRTECNFNRKCMTNIDSYRVIEAVENILPQPEIEVKNLRFAQS